ncbi:hypothetical protein BpHYR1_037254 [Brachionus plicatilis]|uniref:Uncharacterized protein n=1 Tax=Brachionus plicatilis TaxID=10195 RepID=A0A3M7SFJ2_BRAPC|nr:hypothetical protein BpHYR1_037254 [Brachionus plicatilis]
MYVGAIFYDFKDLTIESRQPLTPRVNGLKSGLSFINLPIVSANVAFITLSHPTNGSSSITISSTNSTNQNKRRCSFLTFVKSRKISNSKFLDKDYEDLINCCQRHVCRINGYCKSTKNAGNSTSLKEE